MPRYSSTEQIGVHKVASIFLSELDWIFREQPISDMGIDAQVEVTEDGCPTGRLLGIQIKTGKGNFRSTSKGLTYYGSLTHLDYWLKHRLPVILVAHLPETDETYWVQVQPSSIVKMQKTWRILIPYENRLGITSLEELSRASEGSSRDQRLRRLALDEELMRRVRSGGRVSVDLEDWYNKSLGRSPVTVITYDDNGREEVEKKWYIYFTGYEVKALVEKIFPWAVARVDYEFYEENAEPESFEARLARAVDYDNGIRSYKSNPDEIYPYMNDNGEVASYRLQLHLNEIGISYLTLSDFLSDDLIRQS